MIGNYASPFIPQTLALGERRFKSLSLYLVKVKHAYNDLYKLYLVS